MKLPGYILCGGKSSRFGSDKARAVLGGVPLIVNVAETLASRCDSIVAVADVEEKYRDLGLRTIADHRPGLGPLAGLEAALSHRLESSGPGWLLLVSCDLGALKAEWLETIVPQLSSEGRGMTTRAVAFRGDFWQPFPAALHTDLLPLTSTMLDEKKASFQRLLSDERARSRPLPLPTDWPETPQVNTPEDLERLIVERGVP
jgi:molybdopterin-guanine dinucleotide biosynthesis protein A